MGNVPSSGNAPASRYLSGCPPIPPTPPESDVIADFDELLRARAIPALIASELKAVESLDTKWMYVFLSKLPPESVAHDWLEPCECVLQVFSVQQHDDVVHELFYAIRINIMLRAGEWVEKFVAADGVSALVALIHGTTKSANPAVYEEALSVLFTLAAFGDALVEMAEANGCCKSLVMIVESSAERAPKARALRLLGFLCRHSRSVREIVLNAIISTTPPDERRFRSICHQFVASVGDRSLQLAVVSFLNELLGSDSSSTHEVAIRDDLVHHGLVAALETCRSDIRHEEGEDGTPESPELVSEIERFLERHERVMTGQNGKDLGSSEDASCTVTISHAFFPAGEEAGEEPELPHGTRPEQTNPLAPTPEVAPVQAPQTPEDDAKHNDHEAEATPESVDTAVIGLSPIDKAQSPSDDATSNQVEFAPEDNTSDAPSAVAVDASSPETLTAVITDAGPSKATMLQSLVNQLEAHQLDDATHQKIARVLQTLVESLSERTAKGVEVVDKLERSLRSEPPQSLEDFFTGSPASTPSKPQCTTEDITLTCLSPNESSGQDASPADPDEDSSRLTAGPKLTLPFFQSFRRGPGLGMTPACTPIASASVRKDGKRHSFSSFASLPIPGAVGSDPTLSSGDSSSALPMLSLAPAMPAIEKPSLSVDLSSRLELTSSEDAAPAAPVPPPTTGTDVSKFRKLLSMGAPKEAVRAKMRQAGVDPDLLDERLGFDTPAISLSLPPPPAPVAATTSASAATEKSASASTSSGTDISKFRKLLSMGAPLAAVKAKMMQAGVDPALLDQKVGFADGAAPSAAATRASEDVPSSIAPSPAVAAAADGADVSKFRKLLSMGAPLAAVKAKMVQAGVDPALLDGPAPAAAAASAQLPARKVLVKDDPEYAKFFKLHAMGAPVAAVKAKMCQAGLNSDLFDTPDAEVPGKSEPLAAPSATTTAEATPAAKPKVLVKDDPAYAKFFKLLAMGAPAATVKGKMQMAGLKPELLDTPDAVLGGPEDASDVKPQVLVKDDPEYAKFFKLLSMGAPAATVKAKMQMAGLKPELLDTPDAPLNAPAEVALKPLVLVKDDPEYAKFFKLLAMGAPAEMVKGKMQIAGLKPELLDTPDAVLNPPQAVAAESRPQVLVKDDPEYAKFFKLLAMGAPAETVKVKMQMANLRPELLDTPDAMLTPATSSATPASTENKPATTAARRAHLAIAIKPPVKQATRSFYWQQLKGDAIKGTIWEEIEKERSAGHNNEMPLVLSESELAALESEFPPPQAANGPGTRGRTNSVDHTASGGAPGSPLASPRVVFLIDRSRANNVSIIIKQFRISNAALREAIMKLDANVLTLERVQGLLKIMPTEEEIAAIMGFQGDPLTLNEAERILKELISVPRLKQRLSALQAKLQFPTLARDLQTKVGKLRAASLELSQSAELKTTLLVVLQVGNKMNQGTNRGDAKGFRLGDLTKLAQMKSVDRGVTLLHFVARMLRLKKGNLVRLSDALSSLYDVQNIPIPELQGDMGRVAEVTENISTELSAQKLKNAIEEKESCDLFVKVMDEFMSSASSTTASLKHELDSTMQLLKDTMQRYDKDTDADEPAAPESAGPPSAASMASACEFFSTVYEFSVALSKADRENELRRLKEERQLKLQQQKSQLPVRSHSSVDLLSGLPGRGKSAKADELAGPETPDRSLAKKDATSKIPGRGGMSPVTRSASLSCIVELKPPSAAVLDGEASSGAASKVPAASSAAAVKKVGKTPEKPPIEKSKAKKVAEKPSPPGARAAKRDEPSKLGKPLAKDTGKFKAKTMMAVPGKIIRATKHSSNVISPLKIAPTKAPASATDSGSGPLSSLKKMANSSVEKSEKSKRRASSGERVVPFDDAASTLEDIRSKLERKHSSSAANSSSRHARKPETSESETEPLLDNNSSSRPPSPDKSEVAEQEDEERGVQVLLAPAVM